MKKILITRKLIKESEEYASHLFKVKFNVDDKLLSKEEIITQSNDCDGIISTITEDLDNEIISRLSKNIKIISNFGVGFSNIDINAAKQKNIIVTNTPDVLTEATAEIAMFIILGAARRATEGIKYARNQNWKWSSDFLIGKELNQANLGILGMGRIGRAVARRARSFGMKIHYCNRVRLSPDLENESIYHDNIKSLFSVSDFLSINCSSTKETKHIINKKTLNYFPKGAVIANSARGEVIEDNSMIEALKSGKIFSLGLDVYNGEPNIHPEYLALSNVFVLPHLGSASYKTRKAMSDLAINNLKDFFENGNCKNTVK